MFPAVLGKCAHQIVRLRPGSRDGKGRNLVCPRIPAHDPISRFGLLEAQMPPLESSKMRKIVSLE